MTVTGPLAADGLGMVLPHEHIFANLVPEYRGDGLLNDPDLAVQEVLHFAATGGKTIVDLTSPEIGRDPQMLVQVSEATGVAIVMGCGHYRDPYLDRAWFDRHSVDEIAAYLVSEAREGVGGTGIRPGIIGEVGSDKWYVSAAEERSFRAAARAHLETGLAISTHAARWPVGTSQLALLAAEGVDPRRVIIGHADMVPGPGYQLELAARGCFVELDGFGTDSQYAMDRALGYLLRLRTEGHLEQVLVSHDVFLTSHLHVHGGNGYDYIPTTLIPRLSAHGLTEAEITTLTVDNPRAALTGERR
jgi:phosphotriesterase-related protein